MPPLMMPTGAPPPGMPPGMPGAAPPAGGTGAATAPGPMPGHAAQAMTAVKMAVEALQKALPGIPMGSDMHNAVLKAVTEISKHLDKAGAEGDQASMIQQLAQMARGAQTQPPQAAAMQRMFPGPGQGAPPPPAMQ